jgi:hypothetical protein
MKSLILYGLIIGSIYYYFTGGITKDNKGQIIINTQQITTDLNAKKIQLESVYNASK